MKPFLLVEKAAIAIIVIGMRGNVRLLLSLALALGSLAVSMVTKPYIGDAEDRTDQFSRLSTFFMVCIGVAMEMTLVEKDTGLVLLAVNSLWIVVVFVYRLHPLPSAVLRHIRVLWYKSKWTKRDLATIADLPYSKLHKMSSLEFSAASHKQLVHVFLRVASLQRKLSEFPENIHLENIDGKSSIIPVSWTGSLWSLNCLQALGKGLDDDSWQTLLDTLRNANIHVNSFCGVSEGQIAVNFSNLNFGPLGTKIVATEFELSGQISNVDSLILSGNILVGRGEEHIDQFIALSAFFTTLKEVNLNDCRLGAKSAVQLASVLNDSTGTALTSMSCLSNRFDDESLATLLSAFDKSTVFTLSGIREGQTDLDFSKLHLYPIDIKILLAEFRGFGVNSHFNKLMQLTIARNDAIVYTLTVGEERIDISSKEFGPRDVELLVTWIARPIVNSGIRKLTSVNVLQNPLGDDGLAMLAAAVETSSIGSICGLTKGQTSADWSMQHFSSFDCKVIAMDIRLRRFSATLSTLSLSGNHLLGSSDLSGQNKFEYTGFSTLCDSFKASTLNDIDLSECQLDAKAIRMLGEAIQCPNKISRLKVQTYTLFAGENAIDFHYDTIQRLDSFTSPAKTERQEKQDLLMKFEKLRRSDDPISKRFNFSSNIEEMRFEYNRIKAQKAEVEAEAKVFILTAWLQRIEVSSTLTRVSMLSCKIDNKAANTLIEFFEQNTNIRSLLGIEDGVAALDLSLDRGNTSASAQRKFCPGHAKLLAAEILANRATIAITSLTCVSTGSAKIKHNNGSGGNGEAIRSYTLTVGDEAIDLSSKNLGSADVDVIRAWIKKAEVNATLKSINVLRNLLGVDDLTRLVADAKVASIGSICGLSEGQPLFDCSKKHVLKARENALGNLHKVEDRVFSEATHQSLLNWSKHKQDAEQFGPFDCMIIAADIGLQRFSADVNWLTLAGSPIGKSWGDGWARIRGILRGQEFCHIQQFAQAIAHLKILDLRDCSFNAKSVAVLAESIPWKISKLTSLSCTSTGIDSENFSHQYTLFAADAALNLSSKALGSSDVGLIASWMTKTDVSDTIKTVDLSDNKIFDANNDSSGWNALCKALRDTSVEVLKLANVGISVEKMKLLADTVRGIGVLRRIDLSQNFLLGSHLATMGAEKHSYCSEAQQAVDQSGWKILCSALAGLSVEELALRSVGLGFAGLTSLVTVIPSMAMLTSLSLSGCPIGCPSIVKVKAGAMTDAEPVLGNFVIVNGRVAQLLANPRDDETTNMRWLDNWDSARNIKTSEISGCVAKRRRHTDLVENYGHIESFWQALNQLTTLELVDCAFNEASIAVLARAMASVDTALTSLTFSSVTSKPYKLSVDDAILDVNTGDIRPADIILLTAWVRNPSVRANLKSVVLYGNRLNGATLVERYKSSSDSKSTRQTKWEKIDSNMDNLISFCKALPDLDEVDLRNCRLGPVGAAEVARVLSSAERLSLLLDKNGIFGDIEENSNISIDVEMAAPKLSHVDLHKAQRFFNALQASSLMALSLQQTGIGPKGVINLCDAIKTMRSLVSLNLSDNPIGCHLACTMKNNPAILDQVQDFQRIWKDEKVLYGAFACLDGRWAEVISTSLEHEQTELSETELSGLYEQTERSGRRHDRKSRRSAPDVVNNAHAQLRFLDDGQQIRMTASLTKLDEHYIEDLEKSIFKSKSKEIFKTLTEQIFKRLSKQVPIVKMRTDLEEDYRHIEQLAQAASQLTTLDITNCHFDSRSFADLTQHFDWDGSPLARLNVCLQALSTLEYTRVH
eukprot:COSAG01_NODE_2167_length_8252_cov_3.073961_2_plen_1786_part_00